jgi:hypothetical protein
LVKYSSSKLKISATRVFSSSGIEIVEFDELGRISGSTI